MTSADAAPPYTDSRQIWDTSWEDIFTYPVADTGSTVLPGLQRMNESYDNSGAGVADGMAERDRATTDNHVRSGTAESNG